MVLFFVSDFDHNFGLILLYAKRELDRILELHSGDGLSFLPLFHIVFVNE